MRFRYGLLAMLYLISPLSHAEEPAKNRAALRGIPMADNGKCCNTLAEVRDHIDAIDNQIITLMAERQQYVHEASRFKANPAQVEAPARVDEVVEKVVVLAKEKGLSPEVAELTYRALIRAFVDYEQRVFAASQSVNTKTAGH